MRYTFTEINSSSDSDVITASTTNKNIIVKNMDVIYINTNGIIYVPVYTTYKNVCVEHNNILFKGVEMVFNPYGTIRAIDCNIVIEDTEGVELKRHLNQIILRLVEIL